MSLYIDGSDYVYLEANGSSYNTNLKINNGWNFYSLSWEKLISSNSQYTFSYNFRVYVNNSKYETQLSTNLGFLGLKTSIGRLYDEKKVGTNTFYDPFYGLLEMLVTKNVYLTDTNISIIKSNIEVKTISKYYDSINMLKNIKISKDTNIVYEKDITYKVFDDDHNRLTTNVQNETLGKPGNTDDYNISYTYDVLGNISTMNKKNNQSNDYMFNYEYDFLNRLKREDNPILQQSICFEYDGNGNIKNKKYYPLGTINEQEPTNIPEPSLNYTGMDISLLVNGKPFTQIIKLNVGDSIPSFNFEIKDANTGQPISCAISFTSQEGLNDTNEMGYITRTDNFNSQYVNGTVKIVIEVINPGMNANNSNKTENFLYDNTVWKDRLTNYNVEYEDGNGNLVIQNKVINYDNAYIGNPIVYGAENSSKGVHFSWRGRNLDSYNDDSDIKNLQSIQYQYNDSNLRFKKTNGSQITEYFYDGDKLIAEKTGTNVKYFSYDENDQLVSININGNEYYYVRDIYQTI